MATRTWRDELKDFKNWLIDAAMWLVLAVLLLCAMAFTNWASAAIM